VITPDARVNPARPGRALDEICPQDNDFLAEWPIGRPPQTLHG